LAYRAIEAGRWQIAKPTDNMFLQAFSSDLASMETSLQDSDFQRYAAMALLTVCLVTVSIILWQRDFFGGIYRFFILFKVNKLTLYVSDPASLLDTAGATKSAPHFCADCTRSIWP
jgi:hypothetical protein